MTKFFKYFLFFSILFSSFQLYSQNAINERVKENSQARANTDLFNVFTEINDPNLDNRVPTSVLSDKQIFKVEEQTVKSIKTNASENLRINLPIEGQSFELELFKATLFTPDFHATTASKETIQIDEGVHYWGIVKNNPNSLVSLSFFDKEIIGTIYMDNGAFTLGQLEGTDAYLLYRNTNLDFNPNISCGSLPDKFSRVPDTTVPENSQNSVAAGCVRLHVEADYSLYLNKGSSVTNTTNYINGVFSQVAILYANESITTVISYLNVWNIPSPYGNGTELDDLTAQSFGRTHGDLVHIVHRNSGGGVAYLDVLCNSTLNTGASGVFGNYNNVPTYSWDVNVITHEIGHNLGSPHTHACAWNGNNTAIDGCGDAAGYGEGCSGPSPGAGTIMSYCHLVTSVNLALGFGQQPGDLIRSRVNNAACLSACDSGPSCTDGYWNGDETGIDCGGSNCLACPSCVDGTMNGTETGVDCGGTDCLPCSCNAGTGMSLILFPDNYTSETTWQFEDASGNIVASGGPYANGLPDIVEPVCLPEGCYDFTIFDSYGDGLFDGVKTGTYEIIDEYGNSLVTGAGNFGSSEVTNFCVQGPSCASTDLDIQFDGFPGQTSWDITDANGVVVSSSGSYGTMGGNASITENNCLPDGCYTLNFYDALNNGMCPFKANAVASGTFITPGTTIIAGSIVATFGLGVTPGLCGNYQLTDANGTTLASGGGGFGAQENNTFCISGGVAAKTSQSNVITKDLMSIRPNLASDYINIEFGFDTETMVKLAVYDVNGKMIQEYEYMANNWESKQLNISNLNRGSYFIQMLSKEGSVTKRFVKF